MLKNQVIHYHLIPHMRERQREVKKMGAIAKAAVIKNRRDKKEEKKD
jgi:hypothetical protein